MASGGHFFVAAGFLIVLVGAMAVSLVPVKGRHVDTEEELLARIERERNPVKKARYEMRLGQVKLEQAIEAYDKGDLDQSQTLLAAYLERMKNSWATLRKSGRSAERKPQGFRELDIALREDARRLEDFMRRVPYDERSPIEKVVQEVKEIRSEVLRALFPAERVDAASPLRLHFWVEMVLG